MVEQVLLSGVGVSGGVSGDGGGGGGGRGGGCVDCVVVCRWYWW